MGTLREERCGAHLEASWHPVTDVRAPSQIWGWTGSSEVILAGGFSEGFCGF
jgi:hypothetical protein